MTGARWGRFSRDSHETSTGFSRSYRPWKRLSTLKKPINPAIFIFRRRIRPDGMRIIRSGVGSSSRKSRTGYSTSSPIWMVAQYGYTTRTVAYWRRPSCTNLYLRALPSRLVRRPTGRRTIEFVSRSHRDHLFRRVILIACRPVRRRRCPKSE